MKALKYNIFFNLFLLMCASGWFNYLNAQIKSTEIAGKFALNYFNTTSQKGKMQKASVSSTEIELKYQSENKAQIPVYVYQNDQQGFVIFGQSTHGFQVLGYSDKADFNPNDIPDGLQQLLKLYENANPDSIIGIQSAKETTTVVAPLLDQAGVSLNQFHHENVGGSWSGCMATAMTQIMCYYKYPDKGIGSHCYTNAAYGELCADFGNTHYNWINPSDEDFKLLSYHVGVSMDMNYNGSPAGSSPLSPTSLYALHDYFGYTCEHFNDFSRNSQVIQNVIAQQKPVYVHLLGNPGHAVVLDGYDSNGFFHINFGWGGSANGYYMLNNNSLIYTNTYKFGTNLGEAMLYQPGPVHLNKTDSLALVSIKNNISNLDWDLSDPQKRAGITTLNGRVISLNIYSSNMIGNEGSIPEDIGNLKELINLNISGKLHGTIPQSISNLTNLQSLRISNFSGTLSDSIPSEIGNLTNLTNLSIFNAAKGPIPASIGKLKNLRSLYLPQGNLDRTIPEEMFTLNNLQEITLDDQKLTGTISESLGNLKNLNFLSMAKNQLSGKIPSSIGNLKNLLYLDLSENKLSGEIPPSLNTCTSISTLKLYSNELEGIVPAIFDNKVKLTSLDLSNNKLTGISENIGKLTSLQYLNLDNNLLTSLPDALNQLRALQTLSANSNKISQLPESMNQLTGLNTLNLAYNELTTFHPDICLLPNLASINISNNKINRFPSMISVFNAQILQIQENELSGAIPASLLRTEPGYYRFHNNRFVYNDIPAGTDFTNSVGSQKPVKLSKKIFKANLGDSITIDIRTLNNNLNKNDIYAWCEHPKEKKEIQPTIKVEDGPVLHLKLSDKNIGKKYYCLITNDSSASYKYENYYVIPCLPSLITDTVHLAIQTEDEFLSEKYPEQYIVKSENLQKKELSDKTVTLISPFKMRGVKRWEASSDQKEWYELSASMTQNDLKANLISVKEEELKISPKTPAYYRCALLETNCAPHYSDTLKINPYGEVLIDAVFNVDSSLVNVKTDSIEITIPKGIHKGDFRLTVVKLDNPPAASENVIMSSVYDVTVSFGNVFDIPILVKFKNIPKNIDPMKIDNYQGVYFDDINHEWVKFNNAFINLTDSTYNILTNHLTKLSWWIYKDAFVWGYTHYLQGKRVNVIYKWSKGSAEDKYFKNYESIVQSKPRSWRNSNTDPDAGGNPVMIQDIAANMDTIIERFEALGLETPYLRFNVYVSDLGDDYYGKIGAGGYLSVRGYFKFNLKKSSGKNEEILRQTLAHEYMHYTQDYYMTVLLDNLFFAEVHAPLADRLVWPTTSQLENPECESLLRDNYRSRAGSLLGLDTGEYSIFDLLSSSWDNDATLPVLEKLSLALYTLEANISGCFLHYMRSYRTGTKLDVVKLLTNHGWISGALNWTWRAYLNSQTNAQFTTNLGDEFDDYVRFLLSGSEEKFTLLNLNSDNIYKHLVANADFSNGKGTFNQMLTYNFKDKNDAQKDNIGISVDYLAAKTLMLTNLTPDKNVVVNYKRKHSPNEEYKIYHGSYDLKDKKVVFVDISDSLEYNFLLQPLSDNPKYKYQNVQFLLLVNKKCPSVVGVFTTFNASFELTAMPVPNFTDLCYADVTQDAIHNFDNGNKNAFFISGKVKMNIPDLNFTTEDFQTSMELIEDSIIQTNCSFTNKIRVNNGPNLPATIQDTYITQKIEYDFITGNMLIHQFSKTVNKWGAYHDDWTNTDKPEYTDEIVEKDQKMWLKKILNLVPDTKSWSESTLLFETKTTQETMNTVEKLEESTITIQLDQSGKETSRNTVNYLNTDYTSNNVTLRLWFHNK